MTKLQDRSFDGRDPTGIDEAGRRRPVVGRFAPSPSGSLHRGSLVAAVGSWLFAKSAGGTWIVRIEDLDSPRAVPGSTEEILATLQRYGMVWDGPVMKQSDRSAAYVRALDHLRSRGLVYDCGCSRSELARTAFAPAGREAVYPGTCRSGLPEGKQPRAIRFRVPSSTITFHDLVHGRMTEDLARESGDFAIRRADGVFAYQLAVVVDDAEQGVTQVIRGGDLLASTARQIALQHALGLDRPAYGHLPVVVNAEGSKYGKRDGALRLEVLDDAAVARTLAQALSILGVPGIQQAEPSSMLRDALQKFEPARIPRGTIFWSEERAG